MKSTIDSFKRFGYYESTFQPNKAFKNFANHITNLKISDKVTIEEEKGYSNSIYNLLDEEKKFYIKRFAKDFFHQNNELFNKILINPRLLRIDIYRSSYIEEAAVNPTHAMLWHRDLDDFFPQIKVFFPLQEINLNNGALSYADKSICKINEILVDKKLTQKLEHVNDNYRFSDKLRVSDKIFLKNFKKNVKIFEGKIGSILFIDTNNCYHKGGQILKVNLERNIMVISFGSITHGWNNFTLYNYKEKFYVKILRLVKSIQFMFFGRPHKKIIYLD